MESKEINTANIKSTILLSATDFWVELLWLCPGDSRTRLATSFVRIDSGRGTADVTLVVDDFRVEAFVEFKLDSTRVHRILSMSMCRAPAFVRGGCFVVLVDIGLDDDEGAVAGVVGGAEVETAEDAEE